MWSIHFFTISDVKLLLCVIDNNTFELAVTTESPSYAGLSMACSIHLCDCVQVSVGPDNDEKISSNQ